MKFGVMALSKMTLSIMKLSIMTLSIATLNIKCKAFNILHVSKLPSCLLIRFALANKSFINSTSGRIYDWHRPFLCYTLPHTLLTLSLSLSICLLPAWILPVHLHIKVLGLSFELTFNTCISKLALFSFEGLPYNTNP